MRDREIRAEINRRSGPLRQADWACVFQCGCSAKDQMLSLRCAENGLVQQRQPSFLKLPGLLLCKMSPWWPEQHPLGSAPGLPIARPRLQNVAVMTNADCSTLPVINRGHPTAQDDAVSLSPRLRKGERTRGDTTLTTRALNSRPARLVLFRWSFIHESLAADLTDRHPRFVFWSVPINPSFAS